MAEAWLAVDKKHMQRGRTARAKAAAAAVVAALGDPYRLQSHALVSFRYRPRSEKVYLRAAEENATPLPPLPRRRQDLLLVWSLWAFVAAGQRQLVTVVAYMS